MSKTLTEIAQQLKSANKKVQMIYAFNGTGKTRLSREFKQLIAPKGDDEQADLSRNKILYYNAFTEDLFYWDNDLEADSEPKLNGLLHCFKNWEKMVISLLIFNDTPVAKLPQSLMKTINIRLKITMVKRLILLYQLFLRLFSK